MWLVVGLGNPGAEYAATRHNAGFMLVDRLAEAWGVRLEEGPLSGPRRPRPPRRRADVLLVLPQDLHEPRAARRPRRPWRGWPVRPSASIVVYDDLDIPLGEIRVRKDGGPGTHKGMVSVRGRPGPTGFPRIRVGIGPLPGGRDSSVSSSSPSSGTSGRSSTRASDRAGRPWR